jgi:TPR repeat protein
MNSLLETGSPLSSATGALPLPTEVALQVLEFCNWGDLARLAATQRSFASLMYTAATSADQKASSNAQQWHLAQALLRGTDGLAQNKRKAMEMLLALANVEIDPDTLAPVMAKAGNATTTCFAPAMRLIAEMYLDGEIAVESSPAEETACSEGSAAAQADETNSGDSSSSTAAEAAPSSSASSIGAARGVQWLQSAFELGEDVEAAHALALLYEHGKKSVELDVVKAAEWLQRAAEAGHVEAMAELALCYELGCGVEQNDERALDWYMKAAEKGSLVAKYSVGEAFEEARGVPQSHEEACLWYYKAAMEGDEDAKTALRRLRDIARIVLPGVGALLDG